MVEKVAQNADAEHANAVNVQNADANLANAKNNFITPIILKYMKDVRPAVAGLFFILAALT